MKKKIPTFIPLAAILLLFVYVQLSYSQVSNLAQNITGAWILTKRESQGPSFILNDDNCKYGEVLEVKGEELLVELQSVCEGGKKSKDPITTKINHLYYLDERGETNDFLSVGKIFSKTKLSDKSIIVRFYWKGDDLKVIDSKTRPLATREYSVSKDGKTLSIVMRDSGKGLFNSRPFNITETYKRVK